MLSLLASHAAASSQPPCGCEQYLSVSAVEGPPLATVSPQARAIRDFALFSQRKIADDLVRQEGVYLETLLASLTVCNDNALKTAWLRRLAADIADTDMFANRVAHSYERGSTCARAHEKP